MAALNGEVVDAVIASPVSDSAITPQIEAQGEPITVTAQNLPAHKFNWAYVLLGVGLYLLMRHAHDDHLRNPARIPWEF